MIKQSPPYSVWIGFDPRPSEVIAFAVARTSLERHASMRLRVSGVSLARLKENGLYWRPTNQVVNSQGHRQLIDVLSKREDYDGAMSTEFAISRFMVPHLARSGFALFMDCDMLVRANVVEVLRQAEEHPRYAVMCVKHDHRPTDTVKMDGQVQSRYDRKNWSSFMVFNCDHLSNRTLTPGLINRLPGRDLHAFSWLADHEIGALDPKWNWLAGYSNPAIDPAVVHWTSGTPFMAGYEDAPYADEGRAELLRWAYG